MTVFTNTSLQSGFLNSLRSVLQTTGSMLVRTGLFFLKLKCKLGNSSLKSQVQSAARSMWTSREDQESTRLTGRYQQLPLWQLGIRSDAFLRLTPPVLQPHTTRLELSPSAISADSSLPLVQDSRVPTSARRVTSLLVTSPDCISTLPKLVTPLGMSDAWYTTHERTEQKISPAAPPEVRTGRIQKVKKVA